MSTEVVVNLHIHTPISDGSYRYNQIAEAAISNGIDAVIITDHNVWVKGAEKVYQKNGKRVLLLVGEEVHNQVRQPQKSHLLVMDANRELANFASDPQQLIDSVRHAGGLSFIAHPFDPASPAVHEPDISWEDWDAFGFNGLEIWNGFSEFKSRIKSIFHAVYYVFSPSLIPQAPLPQTLQKWDELLLNGSQIVAVGGSDSHGLPYRIGPFKRTIFPYEYHFKCINNHLILTDELTGELGHDRQEIYRALREGHAFIGYDLPAPTRGFRFIASGLDGTVMMGDKILLKNGVTFKIKLPIPAECVLIKDGKPLKRWFQRDLCTYVTNETGVYRVEVYLPFLGQRRGWIFSNPIYVREPEGRKKRDSFTRFDRE